MEFYRHKNRVPIKIGKVKGKDLFILKEIFPSPYGSKRAVLCKCICGNKKTLMLDNVKTGNTKSCGCKTSEYKSKISLPNNKGLKNKVLYTYKKNAKDRNITFKLNFSDFDNLILSNCFYCGSVPSNKTKHHKSKKVLLYNGIDRKNNEEGYTIANCISCCKICNRAKNNSTYTEFLNWIDKIVLWRIKNL